MDGLISISIASRPVRVFFFVCCFVVRSFSLVSPTPHSSHTFLTKLYLFPSPHFQLTLSLRSFSAQLQKIKNKKNQRIASVDRDRPIFDSSFVILSLSIRLSFSLSLFLLLLSLFLSSSSAVHQQFIIYLSSPVLRPPSLSAVHPAYSSAFHCFLVESQNRRIFSIHFSIKCLILNSSSACVCVILS